MAPTASRRLLSADDCHWQDLLPPLPASICLRIHAFSGDCMEVSRSDPAIVYYEPDLPLAAQRLRDKHDDDVCTARLRLRSNTSKGRRCFAVLIAGEW